jgi:hypothetical protein
MGSNVWRFELSKLQVTPSTVKAACQYVRLHHRHHKPPQGGLFAVACEVDGVIVGVAIAGRPVARKLQDGKTVEAIRVATDGTHNACSFLIRALWRMAKEGGYRRMITYTLPEEGGNSLKAAGFRLIGEAGGGLWSRVGREREDDHPLGKKWRWEVTA